MAKDLVRTRRYVKKFMLMKANIQAVSLKIQTLRSQNTMAQAMKGVTRAMQNMNKWGYSSPIMILTWNPLCAIIVRPVRNCETFLQATESSSNTEDIARVRKAVRNNGHERGNHERCYRRCDGGRGWWRRKVIITVPETCERVITSRSDCTYFVYPATLLCHKFWTSWVYNWRTNCLACRRPPARWAWLARSSQSLPLQEARKVGNLAERGCWSAG